MNYQIISGFDVLEQSSPYSWHWAIEKNAELELINEKERDKTFKISFTIGNPPGKEKRKVHIFLDGLKVKEALATEYYEMSVEVKRKGKKQLGFLIEDDLATIGNGDTRKFAFQLFDFKIVEEDAFEKTFTLCQIQKIQMDLLSKFIEVCERYQLRYYLIYGSLLGAVRHRGIIPWDDDIDVVLYRDDYEQLIKIAKTEFTDKYCLQTLESGEDCFYGGYAKLRNSNTTAITKNDWNNNCNQGIAIDIMPLDNLPMNINERKVALRKIRMYQKILFIKSYGRCQVTTKEYRVENYILPYLCSKLISRKVIINKLKAVIKQINTKESELVSVLMRFMSKENIRFYEKIDFEKGILVPFEKMKVRIPKNYIRCIQMSAGNEFMQFPVEEARVSHHKYLWDCDISYKENINKICNINDVLHDDRKLILVGASEKAKNFIQKYGRKKLPEFIIDSSEMLQGKLIEDIIVVSEKWLKKYNNKDIQLLICGDVINTQKKLRRIGIKEYNIYAETFEDIMLIDTECFKNCSSIWLNTK